MVETKKTLVFNCTCALGGGDTLTVHAIIELAPLCPRTQRATLWNFRYVILQLISDLRSHCFNSPPPPPPESPCHSTLARTRCLISFSFFVSVFLLAFGDSVPPSFDAVHDIVSLFGKVQPFCTGAADTPPTSPRSLHEENVSGHNDTEEIAMLLYTPITSYIAVVRGKPLSDL